MPMHPEYPEQWKADGYPDNMSSARVVPPPPKEFVRAYHFTSAEFATSDIALGRLKVARFTDLNDPFELMAFNFRDKRIRKAVSALKTAISKRWGLLCFSANWASPVLWGQYAAKHRGVCLGFNLRRDQVAEVQYVPERPKVEFDDIEDTSVLDKDQQNLLLRTKFSHWSYEEELRIALRLEKAIEEGQLHFIPFGEDLALAEVILGHCCDLPVEDVQQLTKKLYPDVVTFKARLAFKKFTVVPDQRTVP